MAYIDPFSYNRDSSVDSQYKYVADLSSFKPIYGSSVSFSSRLNYLQTVDNALKILPASENNLVVKYNLKFLLNDDDLGSLLKTIEVAGAYRYLKFTDPSNFYKEIIGLVEDYSINKSSQKLNELNIVVSSYFKSPIFNWRTSSFFNIDSSYDYSPNKNYSKYDFVYYDDGKTKNKIDNFWFANSDVIASNSANLIPDSNYWNKKFIFETKLPFELKNKFDFYQLDYKNSFIQNIKHKENSNTLKQYSLKFENISNKQALSILLYFEKKCGYRRFIYDFPFLLKKAKVFICTEWNHVMKYSDCNDITATFVEDPNPDMTQFVLEGEYNGLSYTPTGFIGFIDGLLYDNYNLYSGIYKLNGSYYNQGILGQGSYYPYINYYINGIKKGSGIQTWESNTGIINGRAYDESGIYFVSAASVTVYFTAPNAERQKYNGLYLNGSLYYETVTDGTNIAIYYDGFLFTNDKNSRTFYSGIFDGLYFIGGKLSTSASSYFLGNRYSFGYPYTTAKPATTGLSIFYGKLYDGTSLKIGYAELNNILYWNGLRYSGIWKSSDGGNDKAYFYGRLFTGMLSSPSMTSFYYINGVKLIGSNTGITYNNYFYKYGYKVISTGYYNGEYYLNGAKQ